MGTTFSITEKFGKELAELLAEKISIVFPQFPNENFINDVDLAVIGKSYTQRIDAIADLLYKYLPQSYPKALSVLMQILGEPNPNETGMFTYYYWLMPVGKFVEKFGLEDLEISLKSIEEITKRNTGEYAIRPYIRKYPKEVLAKMSEWAKSHDFHLRRLASEGLRPKLPWASKLDTFNDTPQPVFEILDLLREDDVKFVKKSVANHLTDWLKVNKEQVSTLIREWSKSPNPNTQWIVRYATRKIKA